MLLDYIHLNPVRAGLVGAAEGLGLLEDQWSSLAQGYGISPAQRAGWMETTLGLAAARLPDTVAGRRGFLV